MSSRLTPEEKTEAMRMLRELLALPMFNGNRLADALSIDYRVLSRRKKDGAFLRNNYKTLQRVHRHYVRNDTSDISVSDQDRIDIRVAGVEAYKRALKQRISEAFKSRFTPGTIAHIHRIIQETPCDTQRAGQKQ